VISVAAIKVHILAPRANEATMQLPWTKRRREEPDRTALEPAEIFHDLIGEMAGALCRLAPRRDRRRLIQIMDQLHAALARQESELAARFELLAGKPEKSEPTSEATE
jgi:hypothetical protein